MWQNGSTKGATYKYSSCAPRATFSLHVRNRYTHEHNSTYKKSSGTKSETNRKSAIEFLVIFVSICHFQVSYLTELSQRFIRMNTKIGHCNLQPFVTLNSKILEFSSEGVSVASCQILMFRHETGSCYISGMLCPICTKLHTFDKNPDLKRSKWPYSVIVIAPPAGNRKWHVLLCN